MSFELQPSSTFLEDIKELSQPNPKLKSMVEKSLQQLKNNPYYKAAYIDKLGCWRKHIAAEKYRIFFEVIESEKKVILLALRIKSGSTYDTQI